MNEIRSIGASASAATLRAYADQATDQRGARRTAPLGDTVEISELAGFLSRLAELPEDRARRIVEVRNAILAGTYETDDKLELAAERLLQDGRLNG